MADSLEVNVKCTCGTELEIEKVELAFDTNIEMEIAPCEDCMKIARDEGVAHGKEESE